ncbi:hypothetical protein BO82DRAFT_361332 [Aspergillus uvarum CBS 121591]|uniref:Uncharacterized protein n=1 Tax=Aspergillus uvarum CBS 121591 TaxID=1448315 RepID=A0A319CMY1_9EURO|nr:hypothetical protein BO82DRAFT_361332 [Aspergillus uvarum CBS 121591]PYH85940.1 hypothetical protein BO82DRAFT_361332 [Aspergillus uvarum CBS 121591]
MSSQAQGKSANDAPITVESPDDFPKQLTECLQGQLATQTPDETSSVCNLEAAIRSPPPSYHAIYPPQSNRMGTQPTINSISVEPVAEGDIEEQPQPITASDSNPRTKQDRRRCRFRIRRGCRSWLCSSKFWIPACISTWFLAMVGLFLCALVLTTIREQDPRLKPHDGCYDKRATIAYLAGFLGWVGGIDHFVAHHWVLAIFKSSWLILLMVRGFLSEFIECNPPLDLGYLDYAWMIAMLVTSLWWPIDTVLWVTGVYSVPGCEGGGGF